MRNQNITRLVLGERIPLCMGVPVGQDLGHTEGSNTLRWREGRWETNVGILDMVKKSFSKSQNVLELSPTKAPRPFQLNDHAPIWKLAAGVVISLMVCAAAIYAVLSHKRPLADDFAVVPDARVLEQKAAAVLTVDEPWIRPAPEQPAPVEAGIVVPAVPGSLASPGVPEAESRVVDPVQAPVAVPEVVTVKRPIKAKPADEKPVDKKPEAAKAVILDVEPAAAAKPKVVPAVQISSAKPPVKEVPKLAAGSGLVAVTPDGKAALFTNAATRLPEKFAVGDKLSSGEVIKSIDANAGIVKTDAKEYRLE